MIRFARTFSFIAAGAAVLTLDGCGHTVTSKPVDNGAAIAARQSAMKAIGEASAPLRAQPLDAVTGRVAGTIIYENLKVFAANLPKGSGPEAGVPTKARSEIWTSSPAFDTALNAAFKASEALSTTSGDPAAVQAQARAVMQACAGCHTNYRS